MKALLLAAGRGTRLRPLTDTVPKCLVPIHGKPLLAYWLELLLQGGIQSVLINTHYLAATVERFCKASPWQAHVRLVHEPALLGTAGTILANQAEFEGQPVLVAHADNLSRFAVGAFLRAHAERPKGAVMTMMTFETDTPRTCGIVETDDAGLVQRFHEKVPNPPGRRANAAVYIIEPEVVEFLSSLGTPVIDFSTEVIPRFIGRINTFHNADYHRDIGTPESLRAAAREFVPAQPPR